MNYLYIDGEINSEAVKEYIDRMSMMDRGEEAELTIYITSEGGDLSAMHVLRDYIEDTFLNVNLVLVGYIISAMWRFATTLENVVGVKVISPCYAHDHNSVFNPTDSYSPHSNYEKKHKLVSQMFKNDSEEWYEYCEKQLNYTKEELKDLKDGKEVYLPINRIVEIFTKLIDNG